MKYKFADPRTIFLISGGPGTGKSTIARAVLKNLRKGGLVSVSYDEYKEKEWDRYGFDNPDQKKEVNEFALEEFYLEIRKLMREGRSILAEYPFYQYHREKLLKLVEESGYQAVTLYLHTDLKTAYERGIQRDGNGDRHPGHLMDCYHKENYTPEDLESEDRQKLSYEEFLERNQVRNYDINIGYHVVVDVTDFSAVSIDSIMEEIASGGIIVPAGRNRETGH